MSVSDHPARAAAELSALHNGQLRLRSADTTFRFEQRVVTGPDFTAGRLTLDGSTESATDAFSDLVLVVRTRGVHRWRIGNERGVAQNLFLIPPHRTLHASSDFVQLDVVSLQPSILDRVRNTAAPNTTRTRYPDAINADARDLTLLTAAHRHLATLARTRPALLHEPLTCRTLLDHIAACTLTAFGLTVSGSDREAHSPRSLSRLLRTAQTFIDEHAHEPVTVTDIARAAGVSIRSLQTMFRHAGTTPSAALRAARLSGAHADLVAADPAAVNVDAVALRWGFTNRGRFYAAYRHTYNTAPGHTLRR